MQHYKDETGKTLPGKVLPSKAQASYRNVPEIRAFEQTPSVNAYGIRPDRPEVPPHELFHLFTAGIIIQDKVFVR